jgi:hypothetical protein
MRPGKACKFLQVRALGTGDRRRGTGDRRRRQGTGFAGWSGSRKAPGSRLPSPTSCCSPWPTAKSWQPIAENYMGVQYSWPEPSTARGLKSTLLSPKRGRFSGIVASGWGARSCVDAGDEELVTPAEGELVGEGIRSVREPRRAFRSRWAFIDLAASVRASRTESGNGERNCLRCVGLGRLTHHGSSCRSRKIFPVTL